MSAPLGYVFGYGSLVAETAPLELGDGLDPAQATWGALRGWRRCWNVAMHNRAGANDDKFFVEGETGDRPDLYAAWLNIERAPGAACPGLAVPMDEARLRQFDLRERNYRRLEVTPDFEPALGGPVWAYVGRPEARARFERGRAEGSVVVSGAYLERVEAAFAAAGAPTLAAYRRSTVPPACPVRADLRLVRRTVA